MVISLIKIVSCVIFILEKKWLSGASFVIFSILKRKKKRRPNIREEKTLNTPVTLSIKVKSIFYLFLFCCFFKFCFLKKSFFKQRKNSIENHFFRDDWPILTLTFSVGPWKCQTEENKNENNKKVKFFFCFVLFRGFRFVCNFHKKVKPYKANFWEAAKRKERKS